jgi:deazaflavin-dependent oxidoreductase (nitroreductase family)
MTGRDAGWRQTGATLCQPTRVRRRPVADWKHADNATRRNINMSQPLPDLDIYAAASDPMAQQRYNEMLIEQFRTNAGKVSGQFAGLPVLLLKTIGAKTRATRTHPLVYFEDGDRYIVVASKAGASTNPAWYHNLLATPRGMVELPTESLDVRARIPEGQEREDLFQKVVGRFPIYDIYQQRTVRRVPIIVLERIG